MRGACPRAAQSADPWADDFSVGFAHEGDARRFLEALRERLAEFALTLHPDKTRLIAFGRCAAEPRQHRGLGTPETFDFLGFTCICGTTRPGQFQSKPKSRPDRLQAKLKEVKEGLRRLGALPTFRCCAGDLWRRTLRRRRQRDEPSCERMPRLAADWLPKPRILHPWPDQRFAVTHPR